MDRLRAMEIFARIVDTGSFSAASRQLGIGQSTASKTIALLEQSLGVSLMNRSTHSLSPTEAGQRYLDRARKVLEAADEAELAARDTAMGLSGRLRISAPTTFARIHVMPCLPHLLAGNPDLFVDIILDDRPIDLVAEGIDVALRMGQQPDSSVPSRKLATGGRSVVATPAYLMRTREPATPSELAACEVVTHTGLALTWPFTRDGTEHVVTVGGRVRVSASEGLRGAVLAGVGLAVASDWMFAPELADGSVRRVLPGWSLPTIDLWALYPGGRLISAKARRFTHFVEIAIAASAARHETRTE